MGATWKHPQQIPRGHLLFSRADQPLPAFTLAEPDVRISPIRFLLSHLPMEQTSVRKQGDLTACNTPQPLLRPTAVFHVDA